LNQNYSAFAGSLTARDIQHRLGQPLNYVFPFSKRVLVSMNTGSPYILKAMRFFGWGREMSALVDEIESARETPSEEPAAAGELAVLRKAAP
jgi:hypothetical protein